jgi:multicomponent Na+:H+ antiporter subunit E
MNLALFTVLLALGWAAANGSFSLTNLLFGAVIGGIGLFVVRQYVSGPALAPRARRIAALALLFFRELFVSAFRVARLVLRRDLGRHLSPAIIAYPLKLTSDAEITLLANMITLTPGTLSVDVSPDKKRLYVHAIAVTDREAFIREIAEGFERKVMEAFR